MKKIRQKEEDEAKMPLPIIRNLKPFSEVQKHRGTVRFPDPYSTFLPVIPVLNDCFR